MDSQMLLSKCVELTHHLNANGLGFSLSLNIGDFSFSLDTREKVTSYGFKRKKLSPSAQRRNHRRRMEFLNKKGIITSSGQNPEPNVSPENNLDTPSHQGNPDGMDLECSHCETQWKSSKSLEMHVRKKHKQKQKIIPQLDGSNDIFVNEDNNRLEALENAVVNNNKSIEGIMTWKNGNNNKRFEDLECNIIPKRVFEILIGNPMIENAKKRWKEELYQEMEE